MYNIFMKMLNGVSFLVAFFALLGSLNKPIGYQPDSLLYQGSLLCLLAGYLFNFWTLRQKNNLRFVSVSDVINIGVAALFLLGMSTKSAGGDAGYVIVVLELLPLVGTPIYLRKLT